MAAQYMIGIADLHLHLWRLCSRDDGSDRLQDGLNAARESLLAARQLHAPWVFAGDIKQVKHQWIVRVQNALLALLEEFPDVEKIMLPGQHDGGEAGQSGLASLARVPRTRIYETPTIDTAPTGRGKMLVWPATADPTELPRWVEKAVAQGCWLVLGHAYLREARVGPADLQPAGQYTLQEFGLSYDRPLFPFGLFGDIHKQQCLTRANARAPQVWYPGSPYAQNWGELEARRGCLVINVTGAEPSVSVWPIVGPRYIVEDWTKETSATLSTRLENGGWPEFRGNFLSVVVSEAVDTAVLDRVRAASGARHFQTATVVTDTRPASTPEIHAGLSQAELLRQYVMARAPQGMNLDALVSAGIELLAES